MSATMTTSQPSIVHRPVSISTSCIPAPGAALFDSFAKAGVACAEISLPGREYAAFPYAECARWAKDAGVDIRSFHLPFYTNETVDPASLDPAIRRRTAEIHVHYAKVAADMGARFLVVHAGLEPVEDAERAARLDAACDSMAALADEAAALGLTVCVENLPRSCLGNRAEELLTIVGRDPRLRVCFDVNHLLIESHAAFLDAAGPLIATLHISDYDFVNERHWLPGEGSIDWVALADGLDAIGYTDAFNYELDFHGNPKTVDRPRPLTPADIVRNTREIEGRQPLTVIGCGGLPNLPLWP